ncbi:LexA family transcriptional regulator, partial [Citrobacter freundii]
MMPRRSDIEIAWHASIQQEPNGRKTVTTQR